MGRPVCKPLLHGPLSIVRLSLSLLRLVPVRSFRLRVICKCFIQVSEKKPVGVLDYLYAIPFARVIRCLFRAVWGLRIWSRFLIHRDIFPVRRGVPRRLGGACCLAPSDRPSSLHLKPVLLAAAPGTRIAMELTGPSSETELL